MKTRVKNKAIAILLFLCAMFMSFSLIGNNAAFAGSDSVKETEFVTNVNSFVAMADSDENGSLSDGEIRAVMGVRNEEGMTADALFLAMYNFVNNDDTATEHIAGYEEAKTIYSLVIAQYDLNGAVQLYSTLATTIRNIHTLKGYSYKDHLKVEAARAQVTLLSGAGYEQDMAFLKNIDITDPESGEFEDLVKAEAKIAAWKADIENAIAAIKAINVYVVADAAMKTVHDGSAYRNAADYNVYLASEGTINAARARANKVIGNGDLVYINGTQAFDGETINHYKVLTDAETALAAEKQKIKDVENLIDTAYAKYSETVGAEVCYTIWESDIKPAKDAYDALSEDINNNLKNAVNTDKKDNLDAMVATYGSVKTAIEGVVTKIGAIGTVKYDAASKTKISDARTAFNALPADVKNNDNTDGATLCVSNYDVLLAAEAVWKKYADEVDALINAIKGLRAIESNTPLQIYSAFGEAQKLYNGLSDKNNQLVGDSGNEIKGVNGTLLDTAFTPEGYLAEITTCKDAYAYYQNISNAITTATKDIKKNINELNSLYGGKVRLTDAFEAKFNEIVNALASDTIPKIDGEIDPRYKGAIDNYSVYETLKAKYESLLALAGEWVDSIVKETVSVNTFGAVEVSVEKFNAIAAEYDEDIRSYFETDIAAFSKIYVDGDAATADKAFSEHYNTFTTSKTVKANVIAALDAVKTAADALSRPELADAANNGAYKTAVENVTALYNGLAVYDVTGEGYITTAEYFRTNENYSSSYSAYRNGLINVAANAIEEKIAKITDNSSDNANYIAEARTAYDAEVASGALYSADEVREAVRNAEVLTTAEETVQSFVNAVKALLKNASYTGTDVALSEVTVPAIVNDDNLITGLYKTDVSVTKTLAETYAAFNNVQKAYISGEDYNVAAAAELLDKIIAIVSKDYAHDVAGKKLAYIDSQLQDYINLYALGTSTAERYEKLNEFVNALTPSQQGLLNNLAAFQQISRDKEVADKLAASINELYDAVAGGVITDEKVIDYYIISSIYETLNNSQKALVVTAYNGGDAGATLADIKAAIDAAGIVNVADKLAELQAAIDDAEADYTAKIAAAKSELQTLIDALESDLDGAIADYQAKIDAINAKITAIEADYVAKIAAAKTELEQGIAAAKAELNGKIEDGIADAKNELDGKIDDLSDALDAAELALNGKIDSDIAAAKAALDAKDAELAQKIAEANAALEQAKAALDAKDAELAQKIADAKAALEQAKAALEAKDAELAEKIDGVKAELTEKYDGEIESLKNALIVVSAVMGVLILACAACVIVLFVKKR